MSEDTFDVIVVGGGVAGAVCAYKLAELGREVVLIERGEVPGSKNLSGGVFYCRVMEEVFPGFVDRAPIERKVTRNCVSFLNPDSFVNIDFWDAGLGDPPNAVTVLRSHLDPWLVEQCEEMGVMVMPGVRVDSLIIEDGLVNGVRAGDEELRARVVVAADGVNSFLARQAGLRTAPEPHQLGIGVKSVIALPKEVIEDRFGLDSDTGAAYAIVGDATLGVGGGGFLYTNRESVSIGVVLRLDDLERSGIGSSQAHDHFLAHPAISRYLQGGQLLEYGCHLVAEGGQEMVQNVVFDGLVIIGDAAGFTINSGLTIRGMDLAAGSALCAAAAIDEAMTASDVSATGLSGYTTRLEESFTGMDMKTYARAPKFLETPRMYQEYGELLAQIMGDVFTHDLTPRRHLRQVALQALRRSPVSLGNVIKDGMKAMRAL